MPLQPHPEAGKAYRRARQSLFGLLAITVVLSLLLEVTANHLGAAHWTSMGWWLRLVALALFVGGLIYAGARYEDQLIGEARTEIELLLPYVVQWKKRRVELGVRPSYRVTQEAQKAWASLFDDGLPVFERKGQFEVYIKPEHFALVRHLLVMYLARFTKGERLDEPTYKWLRLGVAYQPIPWQNLPPLVRDNPFSQKIKLARPKQLDLPPGTQVEAFDKGEMLLRLKWSLNQGFLCRLLGWLRRPPGGEVRVRWLPPLSRVKKRDKGFEHLTARLGSPPPEANRDVYVLVTQLVVEVETHWNILKAVSDFRDWAITLASYWEREMDYWAWRAYYLERSVDNLNWVIGRVEKGQEPGLVERLRRLDERLARLEAHLWPNEPAQGGSEGVWLSQGDNAPPDEGEALS